MIAPEVTRPFYIVIRAKALSPSSRAQQRGNLDPYLINRLREPIDRLATFVRRASRNEFGGTSGTRDTPGTDAGRRSFQGMRESSNRSRLAYAHAAQQQLRLAVEQLQYFPFQAAVTERHPCQMGAVEHRIFRRLVSGLPAFVRR